MSGFQEAVGAASGADVALVFMGLSPRIEGEEGDSQGDRISISLSGMQEDLLKAIYATGTPTVLILLNGSAIAVNWADQNLPAILEAWYPGEEGGTAISDVLFGDYNPGGRLPVTFYMTEKDIPEFTDYSMAGRTYRYFKGDALYPFGWGLSYTRFAYANLNIPSTIEAGQPINLSVEVTNVGDLTGDEVVQVYVTDLEASVPVAVRALNAFDRISLAPCQTAKMNFTLDPSAMSVVTDEGRRIVEPGRFLVTVGGCQPLKKWELAGNTCLTKELTVIGNSLEIER
jgi:beta-glucosidase